MAAVRLQRGENGPRSAKLPVLSSEFPLKRYSRSVRKSWGSEGCEAIARHMRVSVVGNRTSRPFRDVAANAIDHEANELFLSDVTLWEISLKHFVGKLPLPESPRVCRPALGLRPSEDYFGW